MTTIPLPAIHVEVVTGALIIGNRQTFKARLLPHVLAGHDLIVDLEHVTYFDSAALGTLHALAREQRQRGQHLVVCAAGSGIRELIEMVHPDERLTLCLDEPSARLHLASAGRG